MKNEVCRCPHCGKRPPLDDDGTVCHECHGARFWDTLASWNRTCKVALGGEGSYSSSERIKTETFTVCVPSGMHPVDKGQ